MPPADRRHFLVRSLSAAALLGVEPGRLAVAEAAGSAAPASGPTHFPRQDLGMVRECVSVAHGNFDRLRQLVDAHPALAVTSHDWGYGDWETPLGAASHVGNREIAEYLLARGARANLFSATMLGQIDVVRAVIAANPGIQRVTGPHGITLLNHARAGGAGALEVKAYLESLGDADPELPSAPLAAEDRGRYLGLYRFGPAETEQVRILDERDRLWIEHADGSRKTLIHLGDHQFRPGGAAAVRIRFDVDGSRAVAVTVIDSVPVLTARRAGS